jgi:hypothetical protein
MPAVIELELVRWRVGTVTLAAPAGWDVLVDVEPGTPLVAVEPDRPGWRANLVLTRTELEGLSFRDWQVGTDELLARTLPEYRLLDLERLAVAGRDGGRRLAHHVTAEGVAVVMEQWCVAVGAVGWALTSTVDVERHDLLTDVAAACAASLEIEDGTR